MAVEAIGPGDLSALFRSRRLSPAQRRIAQYVLANRTDAAFLSSTELAERAGVSQPSVTRFAIALGFAGFGALRDAVRRSIVDMPSAGADDAADELQSAVDDELRNLDALRSMLAADGVVRTVGEQLAGSSPLVVLGLRASAALANHLGFFAQRIHPDVRILTSPGSASPDALLQARAAGASWLLAFVLPRYPREIAHHLGYAREIGYRTAVVTDRPIVPFGDLADVLLPVPVGSRLVFDSHAAPLLASTLLLHAMADAAPRRTRERLESHDRLAAQWRLFLPHA